MFTQLKLISGVLLARHVRVGEQPIRITTTKAMLASGWLVISAWKKRMSGHSVGDGHGLPSIKPCWPRTTIGVSGDKAMAKVGLPGRRVPAGSMTVLDHERAQGLVTLDQQFGQQQHARRKPAQGTAAAGRGNPSR